MQVTAAEPAARFKGYRMRKGLIPDRDFSFARLGDWVICVLSSLGGTTLALAHGGRDYYVMPFRVALLKQIKCVGAGSFLVILTTVISVGFVSAVSAAETGAGGLGAEVDPSTENPYPDLLLENEDGVAGPDLLDEDPYMSEPEELLGDPIFEDDFVFNVPPPEIFDPLEPVNRAVFVFNDKVYFWILKPTKNVYSFLLPEDIRRSIGNAFANLAAPIRLLNNVLQGEFEDAGVVLSRFAINSTLGVFGFGDPAYVDFDLEPRRADFGQTLGKWEIGEGFYICLPFLGPSNVRDSVGFLGDVYMHPVPYFSESLAFDMAYLGVSRINLISISPDVYEELKRISLDPYVAARQAYYEYRRSEIDP